MPSDIYFLVVFSHSPYCFDYFESDLAIVLTMKAKKQAINSIEPIDQRHIIKISWLLGHSGGLIHQNLKKALSDKALAESTVGSWIS